MRASARGAAAAMPGPLVTPPQPQGTLDVDRIPPNAQYWLRQASLVASKYNFGTWLARFLPWLTALSLVAAVALLLTRRSLHWMVPLPVYLVAVGVAGTVTFVKSRFDFLPVSGFTRPGSRTQLPLLFPARSMNGQLSPAGPHPVP